MTTLSGNVARNHAPMALNEGEWSPMTPSEQMPEIEQQLIRRLNSGITGLPMLPYVANMALRLANDPDAQIHELSQLVDTDPPIAARFMSVANTVTYWRGWATTSTDAAIIRLGLASTRDLLFQVVYANSSKGLKQYGSEVQASFEESVRSAIAARVIGRRLKFPGEYHYMCGLLHNIGEARVYRVIDDLPKPPGGERAVRELVKRYHCCAGADIAMTWKLPTDIVDACAAHHDTASATSPQVRLVMLADLVIEAERAADLSLVSEKFWEGMEELGLQRGAARHLVTEVRDAIIANKPTPRD